MTLSNDVRLAVRTWVRTPVLAVAIILTLARAIGATTTAFTLAYAVLARALPSPEPQRLVWLDPGRPFTTDEVEHRQ